MDGSGQVTTIYTALARAQAEMGRALKDSTNPAFRSKYAERALSQEELDVATIRAPRGTYDERIILAAAQRLKYSRDWANANLGRVVEGAIFSAAALSNPSEGQHQALGRRAIGLRHIAYSALVALAVMGGVSVVETAVGSYRAAVAMR